MREEDDGCLIITLLIMAGLVLAVYVVVVAR